MMEFLFSGDFQSRTVFWWIFGFLMIVGQKRISGGCSVFWWFLVENRFLVDFRFSGNYLSKTDFWTLDAGRLLLDAGRWKLDTGYWTHGTGRWTLDAGVWTLDVGCWALGAGKWALDAKRWKLWTLRDFKKSWRFREIGEFRRISKAFKDSSGFYMFFQMLDHFGYFQNDSDDLEDFGEFQRISTYFRQFRRMPEDFEKISDDFRQFVISSESTTSKMIRYLIRLLNNDL